MLLLRRRRGLARTKRLAAWDGRVTALKKSRGPIVVPRGGSRATGIAGATSSRALPLMYRIPSSVARAHAAAALQAQLRAAEDRAAAAADDAAATATTGSVNAGLDTEERIIVTPKPPPAASPPRHSGGAEFDAAGATAPRTPARGSAASRSRDASTGSGSDAGHNSEAGEASARTYPSGPSPGVRVALSPHPASGGGGGGRQLPRSHRVLPVLGPGPPPLPPPPSSDASDPHAFAVANPLFPRFALIGSVPSPPPPPPAASGSEGGGLSSTRSVRAGFAGLQAPHRFVADPPCPL